MTSFRWLPSWGHFIRSHPLMSKPYLLQSQSNSPSKLSKTGYNRTPPFHKELACLSHKSPPWLEFCLTHTYFLFQGKYYEQVQGAAMGSPISPLIANIFMEEFEVQALQSFPNPPSLWLRFVDDTFVIGKVEHSQDLLRHINNLDPHIQFTVEPTIQGSLPFLDTLVTIQPDNTLSTSVYRKPTHTDQFSTGTAATTSQPNKVYTTP